MGLKNLVIPTDTVKVPNNDDLVVRGLGLDAIVYLLRHHKEGLTDLFEKAQNGELDQATAEFIAVDMAQRSPALAAMIIACATDEPEEWHTAMKLPVSVQVDALVKIGVLTFSAEGGLEKFMESVLGMLSGAAALQVSKSA